MPGQGLRKKSVRQKLAPITSEFTNRNVLIVDDSIVRGTTSSQVRSISSIDQGMFSKSWNNDAQGKLSKHDAQSVEHRSMQSSVKQQSTFRIMEYAMKKDQASECRAP